MFAETAGEIECHVVMPYRSTLERPPESVSLKPDLTGLFGLHAKEDSTGSWQSGCV